MCVGHNHYGIFQSFRLMYCGNSDSIGFLRYCNRQLLPGRLPVSQKISQVIAFSITEFEHNIQKPEQVFIFKMVFKEPELFHKHLTELKNRLLPHSECSKMNAPTFK